MKQTLKRALASTLAFGLTFSTMATAGAANFSDVKVGDDYASAISMLSDLTVINGYQDGTYHPENTVTRAEACQLIANLLNGGLADVSRYAGGSSFTDVARGSWMDAPISYCAQNGIVVGVGNNKFAPNQPVTDAEFIAMMTRAMGYDTTANPLSYPYGNFTAAQDKKLLKDTSLVLNSACLRGEVAQICYNALFADYARSTAFDNKVHGSLSLTYPTLIESKFELSKAFVVSKNDTKIADSDKLNDCWGHTWVITGADCDTENGYLARAIKDSDNELSGKSIVFKSDVDLTGMFGYKVELYGDFEHSSSTPVIKAVRLADGQTSYKYDSSMNDDDDDDKVHIGDATLTVKKDVDKTSEKSMNVKNGDQYKLYDWDNNGIIDYVDTDSVKYFHVSYANKNGSNFRLTSTDGKTTIASNMDEKHIKCSTGEKADAIVFDTYKGLAEGDIVEVATSWSTIKGEHTCTYKITKVKADTKTLTKVSTKDKCYFDGELVNVADDRFDDDVISSDPKNLNFYSLGELKKDYELFLDRNGHIIASSYANGESTNYLLVTEYGEYGNRNGVKRVNAEINVLYANGTENKDPVKIATDAVIRVDGKSANVWDDYTFETGNGSQIVGKVFEYSTNSDGEITEMEEICALGDGNAFNYDEDDGMMTDKNGKTLYDLDNADSIFVLSDGWDDDITNGNDSEVDTNYVEVVDLKDLPMITISGKDGSSQCTKGLDYSVYKKKGDAVVAMLEVDSLDYIGGNNSTAALVTEIEAEPASSGSKYVFTVRGDDEVLGTSKAVSKNDAIGVMYGTNKEVTWAELRDMVNSNNSEGAYCEIYTDGKEIDKIVVMTENNGVLKGRHHEVVRGIVNDVKDASVSLVKAYGADEDSLYHANATEDSMGSFYFADNAKFFEIDEQPAVEFAANKKTLQIATPDNMPADYELESSKDNCLVPSDFDGTDTCSDRASYYVADLVLDKSAGKKNVIAAYQYTDAVDCAGIYVAPPASMTVAYNEEAFNTSGAGKITATATVANGATIDKAIVYAKGDATKTPITTFTSTVENNVVTVVPNGAVAGTYVLEVSDTKNGLSDAHEFTVGANTVVTGVDAGSKEISISFGMSAQDMVAAGFNSSSVTLKAQSYVSEDMVSGEKSFVDDNTVTFKLTKFENGVMTFAVNGYLGDYHRVVATVTGNAANVVKNPVIIAEVPNIVKYDIKDQTVKAMNRAQSYTYKDYTYTGDATVEVDEATGNVKVAATYATINENAMNDFARYLGALYRTEGSKVTEIEYNGVKYQWDESKGLKGSNFADTDGKTLVSAVVEAYKGGTTEIVLNINGVQMTFAPAVAG